MIGNRPITLLILVVAGVIIWFTIGFISILKTMNMTMGRLGEDMHTVATAVVTMQQNTARIADFVTSVQQSIVSLDRNLNDANRDIAGIQHTMSEDIERTRSLLEAMSHDIGAMNVTTQRMNAYMNRMTYDMDRLANTASPLGGGYLGLP